MTTMTRPIASRFPHKTAGFAAVLGAAGSLFLSLAPAAPVAADPPTWAHNGGSHDSDRRSDTRRDDHRDTQRDKHDVRDDAARLRRDQNALRNDHRDDRRDDRRDDHSSDWRGSSNDSRYDHYTQIRQQETNRQKNKNDWRNLTLLGGAATVYGLLNHDPTVTFIGAAGTLYGASRYEQDRRSQSQSSRARAELFDRGTFERDGVRYTKRDRWVNGEHFYYFTR